MLTQSLTQTLTNISELIVEMDFAKDFQFNHTIWQVINSIRKTLVGLKTGDEKLTENATCEIDALKRNIENILFNHLLEDIKNGIKKMIKTYKTIELGDELNKVTKYEEVSNNYISTFFNQKIGDFASASKDLFNDKDNKKARDILVDTLDFFMVQFVEAQVQDPDLRQCIAKDIQLFPNLFSPLFKIYSNARICTKVIKISKLVLYPTGMNNNDKIDFIKKEFFDQKIKFMNDFPIIVSLLLETLDLWAQFSDFYSTGSLKEEVKSKTIQELKQISPSGDDLLRVVKYDRNITKQTKKIFWK